MSTLRMRGSSRPPSHKHFMVWRAIRHFDTSRVPVYIMITNFSAMSQSYFIIIIIIIIIIQYGCLLSQAFSPRYFHYYYYYYYCYYYAFLQPLNLAFASLTTNAHSILSKALVLHLFTPIFHSIPIRHHPSNLI
jgi:hypothetical protein